MKNELPSILIPVHNRRETTLDCLRHLARESARILDHVILLNDGCTDGTAEAVRREFPTIKIEVGEGNWWWTGAIAHGMRLVDTKGSSAILWLNDDCRPSPGTIERLTAQATQDEGGITSAICRTADGRILPTGFIGSRKVRPTLLETTPVDGVSGFCVAIGRKVWEGIGFPDPIHFPHYGGDTAYTLEASRRGFSVVIDGNSSAEVDDIQNGADSWLRRIPAGAGFVRRWKEAFWHTGSSWRLATDWHLSRLKFGGITGPVIWVTHTLKHHLDFLTGAANQNRSPDSQDHPSCTPGPTGTWVVIPAHNRRDTTLACLRTLASLPESTALNIIVVDDGSTDKTSEAIGREFPATTVIRGNGNLWWTGATEVGMRHAYEAGAEYIVWLNDDGLPESGTLELLFETCRNLNAIVGGLTLAPSATETIYGGFAEVKSQINRIGTPHEALINCAALNGNLVCFPRSVIRAIGWPNSQNCPHAYGDVEYTLRAHRAGFPVLLQREARVIGTINLSQDYARWWRDEVSLVDIWRSIPQRGSHLYFPAVWSFHTRAWQGRGVLRVLGIYGRLAAITVLRGITPDSLRRWLNARIPSRR